MTYACASGVMRTHNAAFLLLMSSSEITYAIANKEKHIKRLQELYKNNYITLISEWGDKDEIKDYNLQSNENIDKITRPLITFHYTRFEIYVT